MINTIDKNKLNKALVEVDTILDELSYLEYSKIPDDVIDFIDKNKDENYSWEYDYDKNLEEQDLSEYTIEILAYLNNEYLLNEEQKELMNKFFELNDKNENETNNEFEAQFVKDIFENNKNKAIQNLEENQNEKEENQLPIVIDKKENIFTRIISFIKNLFN